MKQKIWLTKYALSGGIKEYEAEVRDGKAYPGAPFLEYVSFVVGREAYLSRDEAVAAAEEMAKKKIASLKKQISKLEKTKF